MPPRIYLALLALLLAFASLVMLAQQMLITAPQQQRIESRLQAQASAQTTAVNTFVESHQQQLASLAEAPELLSALNAEDSVSALNHWLATVSQTGTPFSTLKIISANDSSFANRTNFVEIDLINRTRAGELPAPEAARTQAWQIYFARPILNESEVVASLLAAVPASFLVSALSSVDANLGRTSLLQQVDRYPETVIAAHGRADASLQSAEQATQVPHWRLRFQGSAELAAAARSPGMVYWGTIAVLTTVCLILFGKLVGLGLANPVPRRSGRRGGRRKVVPEPLGEEPEQPLSQRKSVTAPVYEFDKTRTSIKKKADREPAGGGGKTAGSTRNESLELPCRVFREYDIRGLANKEITESFAEALGKVLGTRALALDETAMVLGYDGRDSSPALSKALGKGILSTGCNLINIGQVPTPLMNFATRILDQTNSGVMITASHNPASDNGFKIVLKGHVLNAREITDLREGMAGQRWQSGNGTQQDLDIRQQYKDSIVDDIAPVGGLKVVLDCGNGIAGAVAPALLEAIGCEVTPLYCDVDGSFPNHPPDPTVSENLADLITVVGHGNADLGLALDGDGDRLVAVTATGRIVWPDELLMIFARDVVTRHPGCDVIFDVKSTRRLNSLISSYGGRPVMWKTGHAHMRNKMAETGAPVGGEFSGHLFFNERWHGFDDGIYASARLLEILAMREQSLDELLTGFPDTVSTPEIRIAVDDAVKFALIDKLRQQGEFGEGKITDIDGLRVDYPESWGLVRASNTGAALTLRFEATDNAALVDIKTIFRQQLEAIDSGLALDF